MASTDTAEKNAPSRGPETDTAKSVQSQPQPSSESEPDLETGGGSIPNEKPDHSARPHDDGPPDGGAAAWTVVLGAWCCSFSSPGWINCVGSFQQYYESGPLAEYSNSTIAWIPALQLFFLFAMGPVVGVLFDKYGPRYLILGGSLLHIFGLMMASLATTYYQFILSQGVCSAIGVAFLYTPGNWFSKKRGIAMGVMVTGSSVGGVVFPIMISRMIQTVGYPWAMRAAAFLILGLQTIAVLTVRQRIKPAPKAMPAGRFAAPFRELPFVLLLLGIFILTFGIFIPIDYLAVQGFEEAHMSEEMSQYLVSIFNAASLFGRLAAGYGSDKIGLWNMFIIACTLSGIGEFAIWIPATHSSVAIGFAIFFGFTSGAFVAFAGALPMTVSPPPEIGYRMGLVFLIVSIPGLAMAPIGGAILQSSANGWLNVKVFGGAMCLGGSLVLLVSRLLYTEKKLLKVF